jgi:uncharacterized iron-regulated membrane protein
VALLNPWTGEVLRRGADSLRAFVRSTTEVHVNLTAPAFGKWAVDIANAAFVFLGLSGLWIWWPRQWRWKALRSSVAFRLDLRGKARDWNWHNALGFWFLLPLLIVAVSGLALSFKSADLWWRDYAGKHLLATASPAATPSGLTLKSPGWNGVLDAVIEQNPGWRSIMLTTSPANAGGAVNFVVSMGILGQRSLIRNVTVDQASRRIVKIRVWENDDGSTRARAIARFGHTGEIIGPIGQTVAFLACLAGIVLVYTGFALSWRRFFGRKPRVNEGVPAPAATPVSAN